MPLYAPVSFGKRVRKGGEMRAWVRWGSVLPTTSLTPTVCTAPAAPCEASVGKIVSFGMPGTFTASDAVPTSFTLTADNGQTVTCTAG